MDALIWITIGMLAYAFYKWATANKDYFHKKGMKFAKPVFLFGFNFSMITRRFTMSEYLQNLYNEFPDQKSGSKLELIKQISIKDFDHFTDHRVLIDPNVDRMFGSALFSMTGQKWKDMRSSLSPVFTGSKMRQMFGTVSDCGAKMVTSLLKEAKLNGAQNYEMKDVFTRYTNDVIASAAFGIEINSFEEKDNHFYKQGIEVVNLRSFLITVKFLGHMMVPFLMKVFKIRMLDTTDVAYFRKVIADNFETREKNNIIRNDLVQLLMQLKKGKDIRENEKIEKTVDGFATVEESEIGKQTVQRQWTDDDLIAQAFIFFFAGFDTTSTLLSFLAYDLALAPEVQQELYEECQAINAKLGATNLTYDSLAKMKYLDMVISEGLRKSPPAPVIDRICVKDYTMKVDGLPEFTIEKGKFCWLPIYALHHDPQYWPNPEKFDPERFSDENKVNINMGAYVPFGVGPRNCIGSRFALMKCKAVLYYMVLNFTLEVCEKTEIPLKLSKIMFTFQSKNGIHLKFVPRKG